jgi:photosystem II stability/assembly factor-like uncharacterized protein
MKRLRNVVFVAAGILGSSLSHAQWIQTGYPLSSVSCLAAKEGNLFAGTWGGGVYRSTDGGGNWTAVNNGLPAPFYGGYVYSLAVVPSTSGNGTNLFAGMEEGGIWRSTDDGDSWTWVYPLGVLGEHDLSIYRLGVAGTTIVAGARQQGSANGIYRSDDDGVTWTRSSAGFATAADSDIASFASISSGGTTYLYAGTDNGVFMSASGGTGWTRISSGLPAGQIAALAATPGTGSGLNIDLFAGIWGSGVYRSTDNGSTWSAQNTGFAWEGTSFGPMLYVEALAASPGQGGAPGNIFAAAWPTVYVSTDNGNQWWDTGWPHDTASAATNLCINGGTLFAGGIGIWKYSTAIDTSWTLQTSGTVDTLLAVKAVDNNVVWTCGMNGGVFLTTNGGTAWRSAGGGTLGTGTVNAVEALDASNAFVVVFSNNAGKIYRTSNGGSSWSTVSTQSGVAIGGIQMRTPLEGYAAGSPAGSKWIVLKTTDGGWSWNSLSTVPSEDSLTTLAQSYYGPYPIRPVGVQLLGSTLWFGSISGAVYRSTDFGATWATGASTVPLGALHFNSVTVGLSGGSYLDSIKTSVNGGLSWDTASAPGVKQVSCISGAGGEFWATIGSSIAYTNNAGHTWTYSTPGHWGIYAPLNALTFTTAASQLNGWAVGDSGLILHYRRSGVTSVSGPGTLLPSYYALFQNYPNPFNPATIIRYALPGRSHVVLALFNSLGQRVATLVNGDVDAGNHSVKFDGSNLASGVYYYRIQAGNFVQSKKLILLR